MLTEVLFEVGFRIFKKDETGILSSWWNAKLRDWQGNRSLELKQGLWKWKYFEALARWCTWKMPLGVKYWQYVARTVKKRKHDLTKFNTIGKWPGDANGQLSRDGEESLTLWRIWKVKSKDLEESHQNPENPTTESDPLKALKDMWTSKNMPNKVKSNSLRLRRIIWIVRVLRRCGVSEALITVKKHMNRQNQ